MISVRDTPFAAAKIRNELVPGRDVHQPGGNDVGARANGSANGQATVSAAAGSCAANKPARSANEAASVFVTAEFWRALPRSASAAVAR